ncbi:MAG: cation diffusion facilitator family transporter [Bacteroidales bacterium]|nr:cation diffusion facilitator family transporter [Bacteroidales bacterium]
MANLSNISSVEKRTAFVVIFSAVTMVAEIVFGLSTNSMALLADGIHMGCHVLAIGLSWMTYILVRRLELKPNNPYNKDKILSLSAFTSGILLLIFSIYIIVEAVEKVFAPQGEINAFDAMIVAIIGLVVNGICALVLKEHHHDHHENHEHDNDLNRKSAFLHVLSDALTSIGAIFGLIFAMIWNITWVDTAVAFVLSFMIIRWAKDLLTKTAKILVEKE